ncbi:branched-chain amino acid ABC transporter ATP-binding protein [Bradyrhizobium elkanii]|uniref:branched-chain amino acid ABC transporter ATP-binding protein n=1 Tax=Bradyrhizobium elkanii TaxID=29448 RepID=UPI001AE4BE0C|nr:ABC transporter ATP-binding protein [Bradyrhizobium elkanii]
MTESSSGNTKAVVAEFCDVSAAYFGDIHVLRNLSLIFRSATVTGIIGPNGAGKSTVLKTFMGALKPRSGDIRLYGKSLAGIPNHVLALMGVGYVPQNRSLFLGLSVEDNLLLGCWPIRHDRVRTRRILDRALTEFPMLGAAHRSPAGSLSGGQRRFLEIARALLLDPKIVLFDEPTAMIAPKFAADVYEKISELAAGGLAVVLVDQNIKPCIEVSDYIYVLELGQKTTEGTADFLKSDDKMREEIGRWLEVSGG